MDNDRLVSVPLPGFSGLRRSLLPVFQTTISSFSPVAGIQWVETVVIVIHQVVIVIVSVPLPGFSGLRPAFVPSRRKPESSFSPVAGIQWVETKANKARSNGNPLVSVPLPGFSGLRLDIQGDHP